MLYRCGKIPRCLRHRLGVPLWLASILCTLQISKNGSIAVKIHEQKVPKLLASNTLTGLRTCKVLVCVVHGQTHKFGKCTVPTWLKSEKQALPGTWGLVVGIGLGMDRLGLLQAFLGLRP